MMCLKKEGDLRARQLREAQRCPKNIKRV